jgi:hypothetical protein
MSSELIAEIPIGKTGRRGKRIATYPVYKRDSKEEPENIPEYPKEKSTTREAETKKEASHKIAPVYKVLWDKGNTSTQVIRITVSDEDFLEAILKELTRNLKSEREFEWGPLIWCKDSEHTTINAIVKKINENNIIELESFIDKIKSSYSTIEIQK